MKTTTTILTCLIVAAVACVAGEAQAQEFRVGPFGISFDRPYSPIDHHHDHYRPSYDHGRRPNIADPNVYPPRPVRPNPYDQDVYVQPKQIEKLVYNPRTGRYEVKITEEKIKQSALDPNRNVVDRGSYRVKSSISQDRFGRTIETRVESWTSYGVPHSNTTTKVISSSGNFDIMEEETVLRSANPFAD